MRIIDYGLNCILITTHILKAGVVFNEADVFSGHADDLTMRELAGLSELDTKKAGINRYSLKSEQIQTTFEETTNPDPSKYTKVMRMFEKAQHPFTFTFDYNVFVEKNDEPITVMQAHNENGTEFEVTTAYMGLKSKGLHNYYGFRKEMVEKDLDTFTNVAVYTGVPSMVKGPFVNMHAAGWATRESDGKKVRLGLMFQDGLAKHQGVSEANINAFTIDGKLHKLDAMHIGEGFEPEAKFDHLRVLNELTIVMAPVEESLKIEKEGGYKNPDRPKCYMKLTAGFTRDFGVNLKIFRLEEYQRQGLLEGYCVTAGASSERFTFTELDAYLIYDSSML